MRITSVLVAIWLIIGVLAIWQRGYFTGSENPDCEQVSTIAVTLIAGPLKLRWREPQGRGVRPPRAVAETRTTSTPHGAMARFSRRAA